MKSGLSDRAPRAPSRGWFPGSGDLARLLPDGTVDTGFGGDGFVVTGFGDSDEARGVLVQPDGKVVAAGYGAGFAFVVARNQGGDGTPPPPPRRLP
ncbi:hypothetical protein R6L23_27175 [Streptomyces sp. SR27]|uniref:hypothetical protein n=1 Tax=Streptomyces sp. SR27 TaxID=3076630 RepID=UPI00295C28CB|nr:hypothetical protein [Streptomyces sp. SR27]MDV9191841.1 hypothetical protein [Streptomyces sp. SR27]